MMESAFFSLAEGSDAAALSPLSEAVHALAFRFGWAGYVLALWWIRNGGIESANDDTLCNDILDAQQAAVATYFDGLLTKDVKLQSIYEETRAYIDMLLEPPRRRPPTRHDSRNHSFHRTAQSMQRPVSRSQQR
jgi:hypothetical protein